MADAEDLGMINTKSGRRSARLQEVLKNRLQELLKNQLLNKDEHMGEAEEPISQRQSRRKGSQPARKKGISKEPRTRKKSAAVAALPVVFDRSRHREPVVFDPDAPPPRESRLSRGALSRYLYQVPLTKIEKARREERAARAKQIEEEELYNILGDWGIEKSMITPAAKRAAEETDEIDRLFERLQVEKAEGRRRRRKRTRRRNPNKNYHNNTYKQLPVPVVRRFRLS